ncbi:MAG: hypothetical protein QOF02_1486 [Blastocatellia bacterium]|jgi:hypothetical protein|nr:hypothetical protein [Blastocatellia bacterium]
MAGGARWRNPFAFPLLVTGEGRASFAFYLNGFGQAEWLAQGSDIHALALAPRLRLVERGRKLCKCPTFGNDAGQLARCRTWDGASGGHVAFVRRFGVRERSSRALSLSVVRRKRRSSSDVKMVRLTNSVRRVREAPERFLAAPHHISTRVPRCAEKHMRAVKSSRAFHLTRFDLQFETNRRATAKSI